MTTSVEPLLSHRTPLEAEFESSLRTIPGGDKISQCIQCGTCTGSCPVSYAMDITPRQAIALFRAGHLDSLLKSRTIWICASCYSCTVRCPSGIKITDTMYALKRLAVKHKVHPAHAPVDVLPKGFIKNIYNYGRNWELGLVVRYLMRASIPKLFANAGLGMSMMRRGRLAMLPARIKRVNEVRAIINKANQFEE